MHLMQNYDDKCDVTSDGVHHLEDRGGFFWCRMCGIVVHPPEKCMEEQDKREGVFGSEILGEDDEMLP